MPVKGNRDSNKLSKDASSYERKTAAEDLLVRIRMGEDIASEKIVMLCLPQMESHTCRNTNEVPPEPIDPRLAEKIKELSEAGETDVCTIRTVWFGKFVNLSLTQIVKGFLLVTRLFETISMLASINIGQDNEWRNQGDFVYLRLKSAPSDCASSETVQYGDQFLLVYQSAGQKQLLMRYGKMCFIDATYKTTLYDLPLFFVAVWTNVGYQIVGTFICENETSQVISEALQIFRDNCPTQKKPYNLREKPCPKRKSSSFLYTISTKRTHKLYCVCNKPEDTRKYWCCDVCDKWFHPTCLQKTEDEEDEFFCPSCEERKSGYGKEKKSVDEGLKSTQLPFEVLQNIFEEAVLLDGDVAYRRLSRVCSTFNDVCRRKSFKDKCHLSWLLSIRPKSFWEKHRRDFKGFEVVPCRLCRETYKDEGHMFVGGKGQGGMFTASYTEPRHWGYCSQFCETADLQTM